MVQWEGGGETTHADHEAYWSGIMARGSAALQDRSNVTIGSAETVSGRFAQAHARWLFLSALHRTAPGVCTDLYRDEGFEL